MKGMTIGSGTIQVNKLHDELLTAFPAWKGTPQADGSFVDPLLRVESTATEIRLMVPDTADETAIQAVIAAHDPMKPQRSAVLSQMTNTDAGFIRVTEDLVDALITKGVIALTDLPQAAQTKLTQRKQLRSKLS